MWNKPVKLYLSVCVVNWRIRKVTKHEPVVNWQSGSFSRTNVTLFYHHLVLDKITYKQGLRGGPLMFTIGSVIATCVILIKTLQFRNKMVIAQNAHFHFRAHFNYSALLSVVEIDLCV